MATLEHVRISLSRRALPPLLEAMDHQEVVRPRREYLEDAFSKRRDFKYGKRPFSFLPASAPDGYAAGFFGRELSVRRFAGPDDGFRPTTLSSWDPAFFAIDLASDSQIAVVHHDPRIGSPKNILAAFFDDLKEESEFKDYNVHIEYLVVEKDYWETVDRYIGKISKITFIFVPPNALKSEERIMDFIREASSDANLDTIKHEYESKNCAIDPRGRILEGSVKVAAQGGGETIVKAGKKTIYSSEKNRMTTEVSKGDIPNPDDDETVVSKFISWAFGLKI